MLFISFFWGGGGETWIWAKAAYKIDKIYEMRRQYTNPLLTNVLFFDF